MPNMEYRLASGHSVRHLDVAPMISALRIQPSDFENEPRLRQRRASAQVIGLERADAPGDQTVEAPNLPELPFVHSLTLVRHPPISSLAAHLTRSRDQRQICRRR